MAMDKQEEKLLKIGKKLLKDIDEFTSGSEWESSLFLKASKKQFTTIREEIASLVNTLNEKLGPQEGANVSKVTLAPGYVKVFISLYQAEGNNLQIWQNTLKTLIKHSVTRPVYGNEEHIRELIRSKPFPEKLGYAVIAVKESDIIPAAKPALDQLNHELVILKENSIQLENIIEFVHANKKRYSYHNKVLTPKD